MAFFLNRKNKLIGYRLICSGTAHQCIIDVKLLTSLALHTMASNVIIAHNHPSSILKPSKQDKEITEKIKSILALIDVTLLDHFIVTEKAYFSFVEDGLL